MNNKIVKGCKSREGKSPAPHGDLQRCDIVGVVLIEPATPLAFVILRRRRPPRHWVLEGVWCTGSGNSDQYRSSSELTKERLQTQGDPSPREIRADVEVDVELA